MTVTIHEAKADDVEALVPILRLAEPSESALRWSLANLSDAVYRIDLDGQPIGAATVRWREEPYEIVELAVAEDYQGRGYGKQLVAWIVDEARRRGRHTLLVGTANASIDNIAFYQRCGFRMDHVRRDYFWYHRKPLFENGIQVRDLLVFSYDLDDSD